MKKNLLFITGLCLTLGVSAQQTSIPANYWTSFEANYEEYDSWWDVDDQTKNVKALVGLTPKNGMKVAEGSISNNAYTITTEGDIFKILYEKTTNYEKFGLSWMEWAYPAECASDNWQLVNPITGEAWADGCHRTAKGYSIDFSDPANRMISFKYQAPGTGSLNLRVDLWDIKGRKTTKEGYICTDDMERNSNYTPNDEKSWHDFAILYADFESDTEGALSELDDYADGYFYATLNNGGKLADGNNTWWNGIQFDDQPTFPLYLDPSRIIGMEVYINCDQTTKQSYEIYIKDLVVGNTLTRHDEEEFTAIPTISGNAEVEIVDGVVYSEGRIVVFDILGQVVKSAKSELSVKELPTGVYFIQTAEGTVKFVK